MKRNILVISLLTLTLTTFSQNMPEEGYMGFGFNVTGLASVAFDNYGSTALGGQIISDPLEILPFTIIVNDLIPQNVLFFKMYHDNGIAGRLSLGINSISSKTTSADSTGSFEGFQTMESKLSAFSLGLGVGMEKHMATNSAKVDPYLGADLNFAFLGNINYSTLTEYNDTTVATTEDFTVKYPGGLGIGLNLLGGFNYFFSDNISIGGEAGIGFNFMKMGGDFEATTVSTSTPGDSDTFTDTGTFKNTSSGVNVNSYGGVNLTVYW